MDNPRFLIRKVAVLGAGVMGAQIAAHLVNANIETLLFELPADETNPIANVVKAIEKLTKQEPSPLSIKQKASFIQPANYEQNLALLIPLLPGMRRAVSTGASGGLWRTAATMFALSETCN